MTEIVARTAAGAPAIPPHLPLPAMPEPVARFVRGLDAHAAERARFHAATPEQRESMHPIAPTMPRLSEAERAEAARVLAQMASPLAPVSLATLRAWLAPVNAGCRNPQDQRDFEIRLRGIWTLCEDLPAGAFTADARRGLPEFFPAALDVRKAVEPNARRLRATVDALERALAPPPPAPLAEDRRARTPEEIAEVRARARAAAAELRDREPPELRKVREAPISPAALLASYERAAAAGNAAAAIRAAMLREQIRG